MQSPVSRGVVLRPHKNPTITASSSSHKRFLGKQLRSFSIQNVGREDVIQRRRLSSTSQALNLHQAEVSHQESSYRTSTGSSASSVERLASCCLMVPRFVAQQSGYKLRVVGNIPQLGAWQNSGAIELQPSEQDKNMYSANLMLPLGVKIEAKLVGFSSRGKSAREDEGSSPHVFTLSLPNEAQSPPGGGFLVMLHQGGMTSTESMYFPPRTGNPNVVKSTLMCQFSVPYTSLGQGEYLVLCGSTPELGSWDPSSGLKLAYQPGGSWVGRISLPANVSFEAKVAVCSAQGLTLEPGPNRFFDMERILSSHFGDASDADFVTSKEAPKLLQPHQSEASDASASVVVSQIPLCLFSCYWGEDKTPVVVGLQRVDDTISLTEAPLGRSNNNKKVAQTDVDESALMNKFGHIKAEIKSLQADSSSFRAQLAKDNLVLQSHGGSATGGIPKDNDLITCLKAAQELADSRLKKLRATQDEAASAKASFKAKLRKLSDALEMQQKLFDEQQGLQQALLNEQLAAKKLEGEAEAMKLKGKVVEAEARLKEMEGRLAAAHKELEDNKLSHQKEMTSLEANASRDAADAADQIARLRDQMSKAESLLMEQQDSWQSELQALGASHQEAINASKKEYIEAVEGFEWMIKELEAERDELQIRLDLNEREAQQRLYESEEALRDSLKDELISMMTPSTGRVDSSSQTSDREAQNKVVLELEQSLATVRQEAELEKAALHSELTRVDETFQSKIQELQMKWERAEANAETAEAERAKVTLYLKLANERLAAAEGRMASLQEDLTLSSMENASLMEKLNASNIQAEHELVDARISYEGKIRHLESSVVVGEAATSELEETRRELQNAVEEVAENLRLLHEAEFNLMAAADSRQELINQASEMAAEHALSQARLQDELDALRSVSIKAELEASERIYDLQCRLDAAHSAGEQEAQALRQEMEQLVLQASLERGQMEDRLVLAEARLQEVQQEFEALRAASALREADLMQQLESSRADVKWEKFVAAQAIRGDTSRTQSATPSQTQAAATASKKVKGKGPQSFLKDAFQSLSQPQKQRKVVVEIVGSSADAAYQQGPAATNFNAGEQGDVPFPSTPYPDTPQPAKPDSVIISSISAELTASLSAARAAAGDLAGVASMKLLEHELEAEERFAELARELTEVQKELEESKAMHNNQVLAFETFKIKSEEQQVGLQALLVQQMASRQEEAEAASLKLQHQEDVAMDRFKEMEGHLETLRKELHDSKMARHDLEAALASQKALFEEQSEALQSYIEEQRDTKNLVFEAAAVKLQSQAEADERLKEMAASLEAMQYEMKKMKSLHLHQVAVLEANANRAAAEAADEITRLQAEKLMTDALISGQQEALLSELDSIGLTTGRLLNRTSSLLKYH